MSVVIPFSTQKLAPLPEEMHGPVAIENPDNPNEIFIFGSEQAHTIYIYDLSTNKYTKNTNDNLNTIFPTQLGTISKFRGHTLQGMKSHSIIILGTFEIDFNESSSDEEDDMLSRHRTVAFYSIFNYKLLKFVSIGNKIFNNEINSRKAIYTVQGFSQSAFRSSYFGKDKTANVKTVLVNGCKITTQHLPFWHEYARFNKYKNYIIATQLGMISIYDIIDEYNPKLIMHATSGDRIGTGDIANLNRNGFNLTYHGAVTLPLKLGSNDNHNDHGKIKNVARLLVFGGYSTDYTFVKSFHQIDINFDQLKLTLEKLQQENKKENAIVTNITNYDKVNDKKNNVNAKHDVLFAEYANIIQVKDQYSDDLVKVLNLDGLQAESDKIVKSGRNWLTFGEKRVCYGIFGCGLYNSRHLLIYNAYSSYAQRAINTIVNFDFKRKKWTIHCDAWTQEYAWRRGYVLRKCNTSGIWLHGIGGVARIPEKELAGADHGPNHAKICLSQQLDWSIQRLLWIGYLKGQQTEEKAVSPLATLPKDIILCILNFLNNEFVFDS